MKETRALRIDSALGLRRQPARRWPWQMLARFSGAFVFAILFGLVLGALVHIVAVFAIPYAGTRDAVARLTSEAAARAPLPVEPGQGIFNPPWPDPAFITMVCRFDLAKGAQHVRAQVPDGFSGLSLHAPDGSVLYAVTDEVAQAGQLSLLVLTPEQALDVPLDEARDVRFILPARHGVEVQHGLAVYRVMVPMPSLRDTTRAVASSLRCDDYR